MPRYIVKLADKYLEWSTVVDAPITYGMTLDEFRTYYREQYGEEGMERLAERLARAEKKGTSAIDPTATVDDLIACNRAGKGGRELSKKDLIAEFCTEPSSD